MSWGNEVLLLFMLFTLNASVSVPPPASSCSCRSNSWEVYVLPLPVSPLKKTKVIIETSSILQNIISRAFYFVSKMILQVCTNLGKGYRIHAQGGAMMGSIKCIHGLTKSTLNKYFWVWNLHPWTSIQSVTC